ncbi:putative phospholipase D zeta 2-like [Ditylenchus destructor]|uniref:Phospholipase D zeta 2-like n=1 Tax=Ditylenchus destructor TaxID=166010 RepID=A0AAD4MH36_9BILA|nr:putative phospholipase D zeta 2-like [Ditylenchus destructor]
MIAGRTPCPCSSPMSSHDRAHRAQDGRPARGAGSRATLSRANHARQTLHLCRKPVFRLAAHPRGDGRRLKEADGPEIVIVNPQSAQGWLEPLAMDTARARLIGALRQRTDMMGLRLYHPVTRNRAPIYVHAKILIVDDEILRVGPIQHEQPLDAPRYRMRRHHRWRSWTE